jgi:periplasmic protein TonB
MYYATKRNNTQTRVIGAATVVLVNIGAAVAIMNGFGSTFFKPPVESEVVIIEEVPEIEEEPPPPPPIDVDLPPPPPQVILPNFIVESPPPQENAIAQVVNVPKPQAPAAAKPAPAPAAVGLRSKPSSGRRFEKPEYPAAALRANEEGEVTVSVCVDASGRMSDVKLVKSSGSTRLDDATVRGMSKTRLDPAIGTDGKPMAYCNPPHLLTIVWDLEAEKKNR